MTAGASTAVMNPNQRGINMFGLAKAAVVCVGLAAAFGCGGTEYDNDYAETNGDDGIVIGDAEQEYIVQSTYGIRQDAPDQASQWRPCGPAQGVAGQACYYPIKRNVQLEVQVDGIALNADRAIVTGLIDAMISAANNGDNGFNYSKFSQQGCPDDKVCTRLKMQDSEFSVAANVPSDHIRRWIQFVPTGLTNAVGSDKQFKTASARGNFSAMKAYTVGAGGTCTATNACGRGIQQMILNALALSTGYGQNRGGNFDGRGVDTDVDGVLSTTNPLLGTPCHLRLSDAYNPGTPGTKTVFDPECTF